MRRAASSFPQEKLKTDNLRKIFADSTPAPDLRPRTPGVEQMFMLLKADEPRDGVQPAQRNLLNKRSTLSTNTRGVRVRQQNFDNSGN